MLEWRALVIGRWQAPAAGDRPCLPISDAESGTPLGFACQQGAAGLLAWLGRWRGPSLAVHEAIDEPLLCTIRRGFCPWTTWKVRDADGCLVGSVAGPRLFGQHHELLATRHPSRENGRASYLGTAGRELAATGT